MKIEIVTRYVELYFHHNYYDINVDDRSVNRFVLRIGSWAYGNGKSWRRLRVL